MSEESNTGNSKAEGKTSESPLLQHDPVNENWLDAIDPSSNSTDLTNYVSRKCDEYVSMKSTDEDLHELFQLDFQKWDSTIFDKVRLPILLRFRKLLREHGIYVSKTEVPCSGAIAIALQSPYREWTESEVGEIVKDKTFTCISGKLQYLEEQFHAQIPSPNEGTFPVSSLLETPPNTDSPGPRQFGWPSNGNQNMPNVAPINPEQPIPSVAAISAQIFDINPLNSQIYNDPANPTSDNQQPGNTSSRFFKHISSTIRQMVKSEEGHSEGVE